jgi:hypothetical protein
MKKLSYLLGLFLVAGSMFVSCNDDDDTEPKDLTPVISFKEEAGFTYSDTTITEGESILVGVRCQSNSNSNAKLNILKIYAIINDVPQNPIFQDTINDSEYDVNYLIDFPDALTGRLYAEVTDKDGQKNNDSFNITVETATTPLDAEADFEWKRIGIADATGLAPFGLKWDSNLKLTNAQIEKENAEKFVQLLPEQWTSITTKEDLATAVDAATDITVYAGVSATAASSDYNDVLATKYNGEYFIIHVQHATVVVGGVGATITITGKYKK